MIKPQPINERAFTILELLIATLVFSVILLLVTTGVIQIGNTFYRGALQSRTQETARSIIDEISRGIQFSGVPVVETTPYSTDPPYSSRAPGSRYGFCINNVGYAYILDMQLVASSPDLAVQRIKTLLSYPASCTGYVAPAVGTVTGKELLGYGMRLTDLEVKLVAGTTNTYSVTVGVASGEIDLFNLNSTTGIAESCKGGAGSQFCAVSKLTTTVQKRVK